SRSEWAAAHRGNSNYFIHIGERDFDLHPKTDEECKTQQRLRQASLDYKNLDPQSEEYQSYFAAFQQQLKPEGKCFYTFRTFFISRRMAELKASGSLAADPSKNLQDWSFKHRL
ncbi:MAG: hypothetical protein KBS95_05205, partial [Alistipes sp.]|nr:hypothetical protein [Candidatus Alistipes equi]